MQRNTTSWLLMRLLRINPADPAWQRAHVVAKQMGDDDRRAT
jgi:hypothetical protein